MTPEEVKSKVKAFILREILWNAPDETLSDDVQLISHGILDSLAVLRLVAYIEEAFHVSVQAEVVDMLHFDTLDSVVCTVLESRSR